MSSSIPASPSGRRRMPAQAVVVAGVVGHEPITLVWLAVAGVAHLGAGALPTAAGVFLVVVYVLLAAWVGAVCGGMVRGRRFSRGAAVAIQLFAVILSTWLMSIGAPIAGGLLLVGSGAALLCLFSGAVQAHLAGPDAGRPDAGRPDVG